MYLGELGLTAEEVREYYKIYKDVSLDTVTEEELRDILVYGVYKDKSFTYCIVLYTLLIRYMNVPFMDVYKEKINVPVRNVETGYYSTYTFIANSEYSLEGLDKSVYLNFFTYYVRKCNEYYYETELTNSKAHTSPMSRYSALYGSLETVIEYYLGEPVAKELISVYTETFVHFLKKSKYKDIIPDSEIEERIGMGKTKNTRRKFRTE